MEITECPGGETSSRKRASRKTLFLLVACVLAAAIGFAVLIFHKPKPLIQLKLADGRILQIEGITYGTHHRMGNKSPIVEYFGRWLPSVVNRMLGADRMEGIIDTDRPALVVWVDAINATSKTNVDCQGIRVEFVNKDGDLFGAETSSWYGSQSFWRVGHVFYTYPQDERELNWRVTLWEKRKGKNNEPVSTHFENPHIVEPVNWTGLPLPQTKKIGDLEIVLKSLKTQTNGRGKKAYYETPARYFKPIFEFRENNQPALAWEKPEWTAEDTIGNRGKFLGIHSPALKFFATVYPQATNFNAAQLIATLPSFDLAGLKTNLFWNKKTPLGTNEITVLGIFPSGTHTFSEGVYESSSPSILGPRGGTPSGWTWMSQRSNPLHVKNSQSHYTPQPTIYIRASNLKPPDRLAVRLNDNFGHFWVAQPDPEGSKGGVYPFLLKLPNTATNVTAEVVVLKPVQADFLVQTVPKE